MLAIRSSFAGWVIASCGGPSAWPSGPAGGIIGCAPTSCGSRFIPTTYPLGSRSRSASELVEQQGLGDHASLDLVERVHRARRVLTGRDAQADLRARDRDELVRRLAHAGRIDPEDGYGRLGPQPLGDRAGADPLDALQDAGLG